MLSIFREGFKNLYKKMLFKKEKQLMLGRWNINYDNNYINSHHANFDNCGDIICKQPKTIIEHINLEKMQKINK